MDVRDLLVYYLLGSALSFGGIVVMLFLDREGPRLGWGAVLTLVVAAGLSFAWPLVWLFFFIGLMSRREPRYED